MTNISLAVLDEYAKRLSNKQINMLYENKTHKKFKKVLNESIHQKTKYELYLNAYVISEELDANKVEFIMWLNEHYKQLMESITYKIDEDAITFSTNDREKYQQLVQALLDAGISGDILENILDKNF